MKDRITAYSIVRNVLKILMNFILPCLRMSADGRARAA